MALKNFIIKNKINKQGRKVQFNNYETAKSIGILYIIDSKNDYDRIKTYINQLTKAGKTVHSLGFIKNPDQIGTTYFGQSHHNFFSENHITKSGKIKEVCITDFINLQTDILINAAYSNNFFVEYVFALSKASFKVSGIIDCKFSDLNINYDRSQGLDYFLSQVDYYLNTIKTA